MLIDLIIYIVTLRKYKKKDLLSYDNVRHLLIANYIGMIILVFDLIILRKGVSFMFSHVLALLFQVQDMSEVYLIEKIIDIISFILSILILVFQGKLIKKLRELKSELIMSSVCYCKNCGSAIPAGTDFCTNCGYTLNESEVNEE